MRGHQFGSMLLGGWLLMQPWLIGGTRVGSDQPVAQWHQLAAYDTAKECEQAKVEEAADRIVSAIAIAKGTASTPGDLQKSTNAAELGKETRCVPADHVYPPEA